MPTYTGPVEERVRAAVKAKLALMAAGYIPVEVYDYFRTDFGSLVLPCAMLVLDNSDGNKGGRSDNNKRWDVSLSLLLFSRPESIAGMKAAFENAIDADQQLAGTGLEKLIVDRWEFGYPIGNHEGKYAWAETVLTGQIQVTRGSN